MLQLLMQGGVARDVSGSSGPDTIGLNGVSVKANVYIKNFSNYNTTFFRLT